MNLQSQVIAFHKLFGQAILDRPTVPADDVVRLRAALIIEEAIEALEALYGSVPEWEMMKSLVANVINVRGPRVDIAKFADACGDLDYVVEGSRLAFGIDGKSVALAIHEANMAKVGGATGPDGKKLKPLQWTPPDIEGVLDKQASGELPSVGLRMKGRVHFVLCEGEGYSCWNPDDPIWGVGWPTDTTTDELDKVTCRGCLKIEGRL